MSTAKDIIVKPISSRDARVIVKKHHYSGKVVQNSCLNFGVFINGRCEGAMQFGSPMDKRKSLTLVDGTGWNDMLELNRMAFSDKLPRFSESRAISVTMRMIKKHYPHIKWIQSFSDGTQCGDGTIYRASGFVLTQIKQNTSLLEFPTGDVFSRMTLDTSWNTEKVVLLCKKMGVESKPRGTAEWVKLGAKRLAGFQLRYIYFIDKKCRDKLTCEEIPFSEIDKLGAGMYLGERISLEDRRDKQAMDAPTSQRQCNTDHHAPIKSA